MYARVRLIKYVIYVFLNTCKLLEMLGVLIRLCIFITLLKNKLYLYVIQQKIK